MTSLLLSAAERAQRYLAGLPERRVAPAQATWPAWRSSTGPCRARPPTQKKCWPS